MREGRRRGQRSNHQPPMRQFVAFGLWAARLGKFPTPRQIRERFGISRSASYRWRDMLAEAMGVKPPPVRRFRRKDGSFGGVA